MGPIEFPLSAALGRLRATFCLHSPASCLLPILNRSAVVVLGNTIMSANAANTLAISASLQLLLFTNYS